LWVCVHLVFDWVGYQETVIFLCKEEEQEMTLEEAKVSIGERVMYIPYPDCPSELNEYGTITATRKFFTFVRYDGDDHSKATKPEALTLID
jgi:hypothetical protein